MKREKNISIYRIAFYLGLLLIFYPSVGSHAQRPIPTSESDSLVLGNFNKDGYQALLNGKNLVRLPFSERTKIYRVGSAVYKERLEAGILKFQANGDRWEVNFNGNEMTFHSFIDETTKTAVVSYDTDQLPGQTIMFSASGKKIYGMIRVVDYISVSEENQAQAACVYSIYDEELLFEVFLNIDGKVLKGCGYFSLPDEE